VHLLKGLKLCAPICSFVCLVGSAGRRVATTSLPMQLRLRSQGATPPQIAPPRPWTCSDQTREYSGKVALVRKPAGKRNLSQR
jgi:hypothetical protein